MKRWIVFGHQFILTFLVMCLVAKIFSLPDWVWALSGAWVALAWWENDV